MIEMINLSSEKPYSIFKKNYDKAKKKKQYAIEAAAISSYDNLKKEVDSRFVNIKYIENDCWTFFSNYNSPKSQAFQSFNQISILFYWNTINLQTRIKAKIFKSSKDLSDEHFSSRSKYKNALAISSMQSKKIKSYSLVKKHYSEILDSEKILEERPSYWGGFSFIPFYFEFWEGQKYRLNKREVFELNKGNWINYFLQP